MDNERYRITERFAELNFVGTVRSQRRAYAELDDDGHVVVREPKDER